MESIALALRINAVLSRVSGMLACGNHWSLYESLYSWYEAVIKLPLFPGQQRCGSARNYGGWVRVPKSRKHATLVDFQQDTDAVLAKQCSTARAIV